jgi:Skp family chaperone for outer membrane proteins
VNFSNIHLLQPPAFQVTGDDGDKEQDEKEKEKEKGEKEKSSSGLGDKDYQEAKNQEARKLYSKLASLHKAFCTHLDVALTPAMVRTGMLISLHVTNH